MASASSSSIEARTASALRRESSEVVSHSRSVAGSSRPLPCIEGKEGKGVYSLEERLLYGIVGDECKEAFRFLHG